MLFVVTADEYNDEYGASIYLYGVFDDYEKADRLKSDLEKKGYSAKIDTVTKNTVCEEYLGGYIE